jgi:hypothetical protein
MITLAQTTVQNGSEALDYARLLTVWLTDPSRNPFSQPACGNQDSQELSLQTASES